MQPARVDVELSFFPLMWILYFCSPWLSVDGNAERKGWGTHTLTLPPGRHNVEAWFPYLFKSRCCPATIQVDVAPGGSYKLRYRPAWLMFLNGSLKMVSQPQLPQATAMPPS